MDKKSKHKTAVKKKTLNPEFNEVPGAGEAAGGPLPLPLGGTGFSRVTVGGGALTGEPPAPGCRGEAPARLNRAEVMHTEGREPPRKIFRGWN